MLKIIIASAVLAAAAPAFATGATNQSAAAAAGATCDAKYYDYLVGKSLDEARSISGNKYRVIPADRARGEAKPNRTTVVYDRINRITEVACG